ncbi:VanZ family protein [Streptomyces sp. NPDC090306]|uniref:VanZ family protein n=1 Tax=Streptomyces sp. NPDC090306 TaxID=3365961 RepID=UPI0038109D75
MWRVLLYINTTTVACFLASVTALAWAAARTTCTNARQVGFTARVLLALWVVLVAAATLAPTQAFGTSGHTIWWMPGGGLWSPGSMLLPAERAMIVRLQIANAAMFVPVGALSAFVCRRAPGVLRTTAWSATASTLIEVLQYAMAAGRVVDIDDILLNTTGALTGSAIATTCLTAAAHHTRPTRTHRAPRTGSQ